jgi:hypothetical protein
MASKATKAKTASRPRSKAPKAKPKGGAGRPNGKRRQANERLRPGQLDGLVLGYMKKHNGELPVTATEVARGIDRSSGAVANCLGRLDRAGKVKLTNGKPRRYDLASIK